MVRDSIEAPARRHGMRARGPRIAGPIGRSMQRSLARCCLRFALLLGATVFLLACGGRPLSAAPCTGIALVLSVDNSGSVSSEEFELEKQGLAGALRDPRVQAALFSAGAIKLAVLFWSEPAVGTRTVGWRLLETPADAESLAREIDLTPRLPGGNTGIGAGLARALTMLSQPEACAAHRIVNITGDGQETTMPHQRHEGPSLAAAKVMAEAMGVTVNGLVITSDEAGIEDYYRHRVITGPGAFVMAVASVADYAEAIRLKIMRETAAVIAANRTGLSHVPGVANGLDGPF